MTDKQPQTLSKQTVYIPCFGKDSDAQLIFPITNDKSVSNGMPCPVQKLESVYVLTEQEMNNVKREAAEKAWDACNNHILEIEMYPYGKRDSYKYPCKQNYLNTNYPLTKNTEG